jgi:hypothetical protein
MVCISLQVPMPSSGSLVKCFIGRRRNQCRSGRDLVYFVERQLVDVRTVIRGQEAVISSFPVLSFT